MDNGNRSVEVYMAYLWIVSLIWAFSFGIIKGTLTGIHPVLVAAIRLSLAAMVFLPFMRVKCLSRKQIFQLLAIGSIQFGIMYMVYLAAFQSLKAYEVALFTIFTPIYVTWIEDAIQKRFNGITFVCALLAVVGTGVIQYKQLTSQSVVIGFCLVQLSNVAAGQVWYRRLLIANPGVKDSAVMGLPYLGGAGFVLLASVLFSAWKNISITPIQWGAMVYLGIIASGVGFFLWNAGVRRVSVGAGAIFNNLKVPLSILVSLVIFNEKTNLPLLIVGGAIILAAFILNERMTAKVKKPGRG
jgi:drug/metabolite transporter (DMT)-like permease